MNLYIMHGGCHSGKSTFPALKLPDGTPTRTLFWMPIYVSTLPLMGTCHNAGGKVRLGKEPITLPFHAVVLDSSSLSRCSPYGPIEYGTNNNDNNNNNSNSNEFFNRMKTSIIAKIAVINVCPVKKVLKKKNINTLQLHVYKAVLCY